MKRNGEGQSKQVKVRVVDRRHHADEQGPSGDISERSPYPTFVDKLRSRTEHAEEKATKAIAEAHGEIDHVRERLERDVDRRVAQGHARVLRAVLGVVDDLERALAAARKGSSGFVEGVEGIQKQLTKILKDEGVEPINTLDQEFDPSLAEAIAIEPVGVDKNNMVIEEITRGYRRGEEILRPARVKVGKAVATSQDPPAGTSRDD